MPTQPGVHHLWEGGAVLTALLSGGRGSTAVIRPLLTSDLDLDVGAGRQTERVGKTLASCRTPSPGRPDQTPAPPDLRERPQTIRPRDRPPARPAGEDNRPPTIRPRTDHQMKDLRSFISCGEGLVRSTCLSSPTPLSARVRPSTPDQTLTVRWKGSEGSKLAKHTTRKHAKSTLSPSHAHAGCPQPGLF